MGLDPHLCGWDLHLWGWDPYLWGWDPYLWGGDPPPLIPFFPPPKELRHDGIEAAP